MNRNFTEQGEGLGMLGTVGQTGLGFDMGEVNHNTTRQPTCSIVCPLSFVD
jgi:hypothetical protein